MTRPAPIPRPELDRERAGAARRADDEHRLARGQARARAVQVPRGEALDQQRQRGAVVDAVGDRERERRRRGGVLGVAAGAGTPPRRARRCPRARRRPRCPARAAAPGRRGRRCGAGGCRRSSARRATRGRAPRPRRGRAARARRARSTSGPPNSCCWMARMAREAIPVASRAAMSLTVVGSLAFDAVKTPSGSRDRMLGGAATHFALAASFFDEVRPVGPVGDDFGEDELAILRTRGTVTDDVEHVAGGKTFFWAGEYHDNLNQRTTLRTDLNVFEHFEPKLSPGRPGLRRAVPGQHPAGPAVQRARAVPERALRRHGLDEPVDRHRARLARARPSRRSTA